MVTGHQSTKGQMNAVASPQPFVGTPPSHNVEQIQTKAIEKYTLKPVRTHRP